MLGNHGRALSRILLLACGLAFAGACQTDTPTAAPDATPRRITVDPNAYYVIRNQATKVLDVSNAGCCNGAWVHIWTYDGSYNQQFRIVDVGGGYYKIVARHSGKALDVESASQSDNAVIHQWTYQGLTNQQWAFNDAGNGYYYITARHSGKAMTINGGSVYSNGTGVRQFTYYGPTYVTQMWKLELVQ